MYRIPFLRLILIASLAAIITLSCSPKKVEEVKVDIDDPVIIDYTKVSIGDTITPFSYLDLNRNDWRVVIRISGDDLHDVSHRYSTRMFYTTKKSVLRNLKRWKFVYLKNIKHEASSTIRVFEDHDLIETYGIVIEKNAMGIQTKKHGLLHAVNRDEFLELIKQME